MENGGGNMRLFIRRYVLILPYVFLGYLLFLLPYFLCCNPFASFWNYGLGLVFLFCIALRCSDDFKDYYKDKIKDKVLFSRAVTGGIFYVILFSAFLWILVFQYWIFLLPMGILFLMFFSNSKILQLSFLPSLWFALGYQEFSLHYALGISLILGFIVSLLFSLKKKEMVLLSDVGGKAYALLKLKIKNTPKFITIPSKVLQDNTLEKIEAYIKGFCKRNKVYAVRSSAIDEDSNIHSFAGIHESYLNVSYSHLLETVLKVKASATSALAMEYRKKNGLNVENISIAVIIQEMVDADFAGVINTINPITNNFNEIVISVCKGLGDKLVDGSCEGTTYYVNGDKIRWTGEDILSKAQLQGILKLTKKIIAKTERFQDIEFAVEERKVYILQARPITTYASINPHQMKLLIDNSNIIESYYGVTSNLTFSFAKDIYEKVYTETLKVGKVRKKIMEALRPSLKNMLYRYEGKIYYNLKSWYHVTSIFPSKKSLTYMESMMGVQGTATDIKKVHLNLWDILKLGIIFLTKLKRIDTLTESFIKNFNRIIEPYYGKEIIGTNAELKSLYLKIEKEIIPEFTTPILNDCAVMFYFGRLKEKVKKYPNSETLLNQAISNHGQVESMCSAEAFENLIKYIEQDETLYHDMKALSPKEVLDKYETSDFGDLLKDYVKLYGARVMNELKLETVTMIENPILLIEQLRHALGEQKTSDYTLEFYQEIPKKLRKLSMKTKAFIQRREALRLKRTYIFSVVRNIFLAYGKNLVAEQKIDQIEDIFFLTKEEIFSDVQDKRALIAERKKEDKAYQDQPYYNRIAFYEDSILPVHAPKAVGELKGIPSGAGVIKARVSKMETAKDFLEKGNIILTRRTDPGWISLFPLASGLIVEYGSMLSHSFVVAREMGLPAVVGVEGVMDIIPDYAFVILDGVEGGITIENE